MATLNSVNYGNAEGKTAKVTISGGTVNGDARYTQL